MRSFQIQNQNAFMTKLLLRDTFDAFLLSEATITTYATFQVDGVFHPEYFKEEEKSAEQESGYSSWKRVKPFFYALTKGNHPPLHFRIVLRLSGQAAAKLASQNGVTIPKEQIDGIFLNLSFDGRNLMCTSGTSIKVFTTDRSLEQSWDDSLERFLRKNQFVFQ